MIYYHVETIRGKSGVDLREVMRRFKVLTTLHHVRKVVERVKHH